MWCTPTHRVKQKRRGSSQKGSKILVSWVVPCQHCAIRLSTHAPSPCVPTTAITKPFSLQGACACWSLGCEGVQRGGVYSRYDRGGVQGEWERDADKTWCVSGVWLLGIGSRTIISSWGLQSREGERTQRKTLRASDPNNENLRTVTSTPFFFRLNLRGWTYFASLVKTTCQDYSYS